MLPISFDKADVVLLPKNFKSFDKMTQLRSARVLLFWLLLLSTVVGVLLFLPWTQNVRVKGKLTALHPEDRPQAIHATIAGRIEKWYVSEGQAVQKGDTIVFLSEIKSEYFDPNLIERSDMQVKSKSAAMESYQSKIQQLDQQIVALNDNLHLKIEQLKNKVQQAKLKIQTDSIELVAATADQQIAQKQVERAQELYAKSLIALNEQERRQLKLQETNSKKMSSENKMLASRNELLNAKIELNNISNEYGEKIAKARSDRFTAQSDLYDAQGGIAKLQSQLSSYEVRSGFYYITASRDCYIVKAMTMGIGETVKEGEEIVRIMPVETEIAAELYINPMDVPIVHVGSDVRLLFDGWPALVVSGWQQASFGTFAGKVYSIDRFANSDSKYRVLVQADTTGSEDLWPEALRVGSGANGVILLSEVPVWYELWRQFNGFPPEFYGIDDASEIKNKAPIQKIK